MFFSSLASVRCFPCGSTAIGYRHVPGSRTVCRSGLFDDTVCTTTRTYPRSYWSTYRSPCYTTSWYRPGYRSLCYSNETSIGLGILKIGLVAAILSSL